MKELWRFVKTSGIYFAGTVLTKLLTFLLLPIYTAYIDPAGMGIFDAALAYVNFLTSFLYLDIWSAIMRFLYEYQGEERKKPLNSGLAIFLLSTALYTAVMAAVQMIFHVDYMLYIYLYGLMGNVQNLMGYVARTQGKNVLYASGGLLGSFAQIMTNILLLVVLHMDYSALFLSVCVGAGVNVLYLGWGTRIWRLISIRAFDRGLFVRMLRFSLPLCVNTVAFWFLTSYNRVAIVRVLGNEANGIYAVAGRFGSFITLFTTGFNMAWQEISYSKEAGGAQDQSLFYTRAINSYVKFLGMGLIMLIPAVYVIYPLMINSAYAEGKDMVPLCLLGTIASAVSLFLGNIFTAIKKNNLLFYTTVAGSMVNVAAVHLLLPLIGVQGASVALFLGYGINCVIRIRMLQRELRFRMEVWVPAVILALFALVWAVYCFGGLGMNLLALLAGGALTVWFFRKELREICGSLAEKLRKEDRRG